MGRPPRDARGGIVYHVLNLANARMTIFEDAGDYEAFEGILEEAVERVDMRLLAYCVMPTTGIWSSGRGRTRTSRGSPVG